jgi:peptide/nickel transport system permease protein
VTRFVLGRALEAILAVWGAATIVFVVTRLLGDPATLLVEPGATAEELDNVRRHLGIDQPLWIQYLAYLGQMLRGDFGVSFQSGRPALGLILEALPATFHLTIAAIFLGIIIGSVAGTVSALRRGTIAELIVMVVTLIGQATPIFWLGLLAILFFAVHLGLVPTGGYGTPLHLVMPACVLSVYTSATIARLLRSSILDVLNEDYIRTAHAKGLLPRTILFWHIIRNALIPVLTMTAVMTGEMLGGSVVTETVFTWPGVGRTIVQAIGARDFPVVQAGVMVIAIIFVLVNLTVDLLYGVLDPRIKINGGASA